VAGEVGSLIIDDTNLYPDSDSRSENRHFLVPMEVDGLIELRKLINRMIRKRNKTLKK